MKLATLASSGGNHSASDWAHATTSIIFQSENPSANEVRQHIIDALEFSYSEIISMERALLTDDPEHCAKPYDIGFFADVSASLCQNAAKDTSFVLSDEWKDAAFQTIGDHFATAVHIERLLYADQHPENPTAVAYRARFHK